MHLWDERIRLNRNAMLHVIKDKWNNNEREREKNEKKKKKVSSSIENRLCQLIEIERFVCENSK